MRDKMATSPDETEPFGRLTLSESDSNSGSGCESDLGSISTPATTPRTPRPSDPKTLHCPYDSCPKSFNRQARLVEHLRSHTNTRPFKCPHSDCPKDFLRDSHLKHHIKSAHTTVRDHVCPVEGCGKSFATGTRLRRHEAAHAGREKYQCTGYEGCNKTFRKGDTLRRHVIKDHEAKRPFPCPNVDSATGKPCKKAFDTAEKLRAHKRAMHDQERFACTECLQYPRSGDQILEDEGEFEGQAFFATYAELQLHMAIVHPPTCSYCPTSFITPRELKRHLDLVHKIKDPEEQNSSSAFPCIYSNCKRTFSKKGNLHVHVKTVHEKRRDFVCGETELNLSELIGSSGMRGAAVEIEGCGRDFTSKSTLEEHVRTAHLGLGSKRVERERKRKADREGAALEAGLGPQQKKRKSRKGLGKKNTALSALTGVPLDANSDEEDMGGLTGFETMVDGQIYGHDLGYTDSTAYVQHTYDPLDYTAPAEYEHDSYAQHDYEALATDQGLFEPADIFEDAEFVSAPPLDPSMFEAV